ncbi:MAG: phosphocholine cytidylyltransferase family protein [Alphaproteobacteria bacterium]|nr:phosphocholine cytidylyltransferase family protein [Alphaproteobacteria bacterium]
MKAVILSAGQGRRLLPYTANLPKCLVPISGRPLLEWQLRSMAGSRISEVVIVSGFQSQAVEVCAARMQPDGLNVRVLFNPFFTVSDNLASLYLAADELRDGGLILNGDTLFEPAVLEKLLRESQAPVNVTIDRKARYDDDDMKVQTDGLHLCAIGKTLSSAETSGESIGMLRLTPEGAALMKSAMETVLRGSDGFKRWYLSAVDWLAKNNYGSVGTVSIEGLGWCEVDCPADMTKAETLVRGFSASRNHRQGPGRLRPAV